MRFRPANISLINRRLYLPRLRLTLSSIEKKDHRILTGHYISMSVLPTIGNNARSASVTRSRFVSMYCDEQTCAHANGLRVVGGKAVIISGFEEPTEAMFAGWPEHEISS